MSTTLPAEKNVPGSTHDAIPRTSSAVATITSSPMSTSNTAAMTLLKPSV